MIIVGLRFRLLYLCLIGVFIDRRSARVRD